MSRIWNKREIVIEYVHVRKTNDVGKKISKSEIFKMFKQHSVLYIKTLHAWEKVIEYCIGYYFKKAFFK